MELKSKVLNRIGRFLTLENDKLNTDETNELLNEVESIFDKEDEDYSYCIDSDLLHLNNLKVNYVNKDVIDIRRKALELTKIKYAGSNISTKDFLQRTDKIYNYLLKGEVPQE